MEILSDATFKGATRFKKRVTIEDGLGVWGNANLDNLLVPNGIESCGDIRIVGGAKIVFCSDGGGVALYCSSKPGNTELIKSWSDLNSILNFAPSSLSSTVSSLCTTVSSNTTKINSACSTISSLCTKVNSLCTTVSSNTTKINSLCTKVAGIQSYTKHALGNPSLPVGCTKFYFVDNFDNAATNYSGCKADLYKIIPDTDLVPSSTKVFKGGSSGLNEEIQMDIKQHTSGNNRWFEGSLASNTTGYPSSEFILLFDEFQEMCTTATVPQ